MSFEEGLACMFGGYLLRPDEGDWAPLKMKDKVMAIQTLIKTCPKLRTIEMDPAIPYLVEIVGHGSHPGDSDSMVPIVPPLAWGIFNQSKWMLYRPLLHDDESESDSDWSMSSGQCQVRWPSAFHQLLLSEVFVSHGVVSSFD